MARNIKKLPKWAIKQAGGINKKAWALARRGMRKTGGRKTPKKAKRRVVRRGGGSSHGSHAPGIVGKLNGFLRGLRLGLPAIGSVMSEGLSADTPANLLHRYSGYDMQAQKFEVEQVKTSVGFYVGNVVESKAMSALRIPQMAGQKKLLAVAANFLPEIVAVPHAVSGNFGEAVNALGRTAIGYQATDHQSFIENPTVRDEWLKGLGARAGLGLFSRFVGPMINKHLPKGLNI